MLCEQQYPSSIFPHFSLIGQSETNLRFRHPKIDKCGWENKCSCTCNSCWFQCAFTAHRLQVLTVFLCSARWNRWQHLDEDNGVEERAGHVGHQGQLPQEVRSVSLHHNPGRAPRETEIISKQNRIFQILDSSRRPSPQDSISYIHFEYLFTEMVPSSLSLTHRRAGGCARAHAHTCTQINLFP